MVDLNKFSDRNILILREAIELFYNNRIKVGENDNKKTEFYSLGEFNSEVLQEKLYAGIKVRPKDRNLDFDFLPNIYFISSLSNLIMIEELIPTASYILPKFFGGVVKNNKFKGILMEDYTRNGQEIIGERVLINRKEFPCGFLEKMDSESDDIYSLFAMTKGGIRMMDFNLVDWLPEYRSRRENIVNMIRRGEGLDKYLIKLNHQIFKES